jgi:hypothetical protein
MALVITIAAIGLILGVELVEVAIDRCRHLQFDDLGQRLAGERAIIIIPIHTVRLRRLHHFKGHG